jgi:hypothetical protein
MTTMPEQVPAHAAAAEIPAKPSFSKRFAHYYDVFFHAPRDRVGQPDFTLVVNTVVGTFAVFTGFVYSATLKTLQLGESAGAFGWIAWFGKPSLWAALALMALLLRYIIGSAIHLNYTYVPPDKGQESRSKSVILLMKDLLFLVGFGVIAMAIANDTQPPPGGTIAPGPFLRDAMLFLAAGFFWSIVDILARGITAARSKRQPNNEGPSFFCVIWMALDAGQFLLTGAILLIGLNALCSMFLLAVIYALFLLADVAAILRGVRVSRFVAENPLTGAAPH